MRRLENNGKDMMSHLANDILEALRQNIFRGEARLWLEFFLKKVNGETF